MNLSNLKVQFFQTLENLFLIEKKSYNFDDRDSFNERVCSDTIEQTF